MPSLFKDYWPDSEGNEKVVVCRTADCDGDIAKMRSPSGSAELQFCNSCGFAVALVKGRVIANGGLKERPYAFLHDCVFNSNELRMVDGFKSHAGRANREFRDLLFDVSTRDPRNQA